MENSSLKVTNILSEGYGIIPKKVMRDEALSIEAKAIYAFLSSFTGKGNVAFPSIGHITSKLGISEHRFYKHRKILIEKGYLKIEKIRNDNGIYTKNHYILNYEVPHEQKPHVDNPHVDKPRVDNVGTNNNSINNNSINNNSITNNNNIKEKEDVVDVRSIHEFYQSNFGIEPPFVAQSLNMWVEDLNIELVMHALELTVIAEANQPYKYANSIMVDWAKRKYTTVEQVEAAELTRSRQNQNKPSFYGNRNNKVEQLPDWAKNEQKDVPEVMVDLETQKKFAERLAKYRQGG